MEEKLITRGCLFLAACAPVFIVLAIIQSVIQGRKDKRWKKMLASKGFVACGELRDYLDEISEYTLGEATSVLKASINGRDMYSIRKFAKSRTHGTDVSTDIFEEIVYSLSRPDIRPVIVILGFEKMPKFARKLLNNFLDYCVQGRLKRIPLPAQLRDTAVLAIYGENEWDSFYDLVRGPTVDLLMQGKIYGVTAFSCNRGHAIISYDRAKTKKGPDEFWAYIEKLMETDK